MMLKIWILPFLLREHVRRNLLPLPGHPGIVRALEIPERSRAVIVRLVPRPRVGILGSRCFRLP